MGGFWVGGGGVASRCDWQSIYTCVCVCVCVCVCAFFPKIWTKATTKSLTRTKITFNSQNLHELWGSMNFQRFYWEVHSRGLSRWIWASTNMISKSLSSLPSSKSFLLIASATSLSPSWKPCHSFWLILISHLLPQPIAESWFIYSATSFMFFTSWLFIWCLSKPCFSTLIFFNKILNSSLYL